MKFLFSPFVLFVFAFSSVAIAGPVNLDLSKMTNRQRLAIVKKMSDVICRDNLDAATKAKVEECEKSTVPVAVREIALNCMAQQGKDHVTKLQICSYNDSPAVEDCMHELAEKAKEQGHPGEEAMDLKWKQAYFTCAAKVALATEQ